MSVKTTTTTASIIDADKLQADALEWKRGTNTPIIVANEAEVDQW